MKRMTYQYKISTNGTKMEIIRKITVSDNETLDMYKRYRFDKENTQRMVEESRRMSREYELQKRENDYESICRKMNTLELIKEILHRNKPSEY